MSFRILKVVFVPALLLLPSPNPGVARDMARDIDALQRAECEYRGITARFDELTRAYILKAHSGGQLLGWQAQPSPYNPDTETLVTAVFTSPTAPTDRRVTWRYSLLTGGQVAPHGDLARDALAVFRDTVDGFVERMVYALAAQPLRSAPAPEAPVLAHVEAGVVLLVEEERADFVRVRQPPAVAAGWLARQHVRAID